MKNGFIGKTQTCLETDDIERIITSMKLKVLSSFESFESRGW